MNYGRCPTCGAAGVARERRPNGDTICQNGHKHASAVFQRHAEIAAETRNEIQATLEASIREAAIFRTEEARVPVSVLRWLLASFFKRGC